MKKFIHLLFVALIIFSLSGCGNSSDKSINQTPNTATEAEATNETSKNDATAEETNEANKKENSSSNTQSEEIKVLALKGPTAMGMAELIDKSKKDENNKLNFQLTGAVDEVAPMLLKKEVDIAAIPANMASVLYNKSEGKIKVLAINTLGVLYLLDNSGNIKDVSDLKGKTIYASGKGATPEYVLNYILDKNNLKDSVKVEWKSEHAEALASLMKNKDAIAMLPQPFATVATTKNPNIKVALDLNELWKKANGDESNPLITGVLVGRSDFIEEHKDAVNNFLDEYKESIDFANNNVPEAAKMIGTLDIVPDKIAEKALPLCNIVFINDEAMKTSLSNYLDILFKENPKSIGGKLPSDDFYYINK